jgi:hypothetical protein
MAQAGQVLPRKFGGAGRQLVPDAKVEPPKAPVPVVVKQVVNVDEEEYDNIADEQHENDELEPQDQTEENEEDPLDYPGNHNNMNRGNNRGMQLIPGQVVNLPRNQVNLMFPQNAAPENAAPRVLGKPRNVVQVAKEPAKKITKAGALGKCSCCASNITTTNRKLECTKLTGNEQCKTSFCINCVAGKERCDKCNCVFIVLPKNNKIKNAAISQLSTTHSFTIHILSALPNVFFDIANNYIGKEMRIYELTVKILENKMNGNFLSIQEHIQLTELLRLKLDFKKTFENIVTKIKNDKLNVPCLDCKGSLTKIGATGDIKCNKCNKLYCNVCYNTKGHNGPCDNRAMLCPVCGVITAGRDNIFCLGCFTFYSNNNDLAGLSVCDIDTGMFPDAGNSAGIEDIKKDFIDNYELNRIIIFNYIEKYNSTIGSKNVKLFWLFVENVLCGNEVVSDHDKRIVEYSMIQADRNLLNKIEQLEKFMITGINHDGNYLKIRRETINRLFATSIDKKPLIGEDMKIKALPLKTKPKSEEVQS